MLRAFADLSPDPHVDVSASLAPTARFAWLGIRDSLFACGADVLDVGASDAARHLAQLDAMWPEGHTIREGWAFLVGQLERDGKTLPVCHALLSRPVRVRIGLAPLAARSFGGRPRGPGPRAVITADGDAEISPLVADPELRATLESKAAFGGGAFAVDAFSLDLLRRMPHLNSWLRDTAKATGLPFGGVYAHAAITDEVRQHHGMMIVVGGAIYAQDDPLRPTLRAALELWSDVDGLDATAFGTLYDDGGSEVAAKGDVDAEMVAAIGLSASQRDVLRAARTRPVTVVSGAPGNGKTRTVAAIATDLVSSGHSVLIATRSRFAARAVSDILDEEPGPAALRFGDLVERSVLFQSLEQHLVEGSSHSLDDRIATVRHRAAELHSSVTAALGLEATAEGGSSTVDLAALAATVPAVFEPDADLDRITALVDAADEPVTGPMGGWRRRRRGRELARVVGASCETATVARAVALARRRRASITLDAFGGTRIGDVWHDLEQADHELREVWGNWLEEQHALRRRSRNAVAELLAALRSGRGRRRLLLAAVDGDAITDAVPLWTGTLGDVEDVLPLRAGMFDVVILDEAAHIDQIQAAPALLRGRHAVVVGDPNQLRHVSFLSNEDIDEAFASHGVPDGARLDVRGSTVFDRAAACAPVIELREHFRSVPQLIDFAIDEFYRGRVDVMTRHPRNDGQSRIDVAAPDEPGLDAEVATVLRLVDELDRDGVDSIGVVSPFREHADRLEARLLERYDDDAIRRLGLRVGTVHAFQGSERDVVILALGLGDDDPPGRLRFVEDPHLFDVMVTRAASACSSSPRSVSGATACWRASSRPLVGTRRRPRTVAPTTRGRIGWRRSSVVPVGSCTRATG